ncbi:hypothetical protein CN408_29540 [Bacillus cereus]|nr:hypothetical protein CN408_29540 [Bacillus cereus]
MMMSTAMGLENSQTCLTVAPEITFTMVKQGNAESEDQVMINGAAQINLASSLHPDIISCSWGSAFAIIA